MKKNDLWEGISEGYTYDGAGVVRLGDLVLFVPGMIEGEEAELGVTAMKKSYGYARIAKLKKASSHRITPVCSVYRQCGGCQLMHMDQEEQLRFKRDKVKGVFLQNAGMDIEPLPVITSGHTEAYRNKVQVPVQFDGKEVRMGFYRGRTNDIVQFERCIVQTDRSNEIVQFLKQKLSEYRNAGAFRHVLIKHAHRTDQIMVCFVVRSFPFRNMNQLVKDLTSKYKMIRSVTCILNRREDNVILDGKETVLYGTPYIEESLLDHTFRISARSFYQINPYATELLYSKAIDLAGLTGKETVVDLYCGTGTIGILCAARAKKVYGIEIVEDAIKDAKVNAQLNRVNNIEFFAADARLGAKRLIESHIRPDVVIVDPPRKGCSRETLNAIETMAPERIVYVSCDPATLARDCAIMKEKGYEPGDIQPFDLFPNTVHVETVCLLTHS